MTRLALVGERVADHRQLGVEELPLVDAHHFGVGQHRLEQIARRADGLGRHADLRCG